MTMWCLSQAYVHMKIKWGIWIDDMIHTSKDASQWDLLYSLNIVGMYFFSFYWRIPQDFCMLITIKIDVCLIMHCNFQQNMTQPLSKAGQLVYHNLQSHLLPTTYVVNLSYVWSCKWLVQMLVELKCNWHDAISGLATLYGDQWKQAILAVSSHAACTWMKYRNMNLHSYSY